jgi:RHS repeat-associated protein
VNSGGPITYASTYDPYGVVTSTLGDSQSAYGYTNEYYRDSTQLTYLRSRFYASNTGRFLTRDTWRGDYNRPLSLNRWSYVEGNPINLTDPSGYGPIHFSVIVRYAIDYGFWPEFIIPPTVPPAPRGPGRWGLRIDLTDFKNFEIYEVEPYSGGVYPLGHGPAQVNRYLQILNQAYNGTGVSFVHNWNPGRQVVEKRFYADPTQFVFVHAWWE